VSCERAPSFLGAYVLGALDAEERREAEQHLAECPACAAELQEFRGLTAQLDRVPAGEVTAEPLTPSPELFGRVAAEVRRPPRRRWVAVAAAAAAAGVLAAGGAVWVAVDDDVEVRTATAGAVQVTVTAEERNEGTKLGVTVAGLERGQQCTVVVVDDSGERSSAGDWTVPGGRVSYDTWTEVTPDQISEVVLVDEGGDDYVTVQF
jgi:anti-sigma factor RsiW